MPTHAPPDRRLTAILGGMLGVGRVLAYCFGFTPLENIIDEERPITVPAHWQ